MKTVLPLLAKDHKAQQPTRDSFPVSSFPLILLILPLILIKLMNPSVETELTHIIFVGRNTAVQGISLRQREEGPPSSLSSSSSSSPSAKFEALGVVAADWFSS